MNKEQDKMLYMQVYKPLAHFDFKIDQTFLLSGVTAILGVSGAGKSTFLSLINGMITPKSGKIQLNDRCLIDIENNIKMPIHQRKIATIFQDPLLFPHLSVHKNLLYGASPKSKNVVDFDFLIHVLNLKEMLNRYPATLSGGEKQRVAIGRALLSQPQLLLMDEPLSSLDFIRKKELIEYIHALKNQFEIPIFFVSHNLNEVRLLADQIVLIEEGKIAQSGMAKKVLESVFFKDWV